MNDFVDGGRVKRVTMQGDTAYRTGPESLSESWSVPVAVLLVVPLGVLGAVSLSLMRGLPNDIYFKIGLITVIGLAAKNAILIIEFAIEQRALGKPLRKAVVEAAKLR